MLGATRLYSQICMKHTSKALKHAQIELTITVEAGEYQVHMEKAAKKLATRTAIKGFRKGNAPYDVLKREVGEMAIMQEALQLIVQEAYVKTVMKEELEVVGSPEIAIEKMAPGNDVVFTATVALLPEVKLPKLDKLKVKKVVEAVTEEQLNETLDALRGMHAEEVKKDGKAEGTDKLVLDMDMKIDGVPLDGGTAKNYQVYLSEKHYLPGFNKQVEGLKAGEEKTFELTFPKDHYKKEFAGKTVDVSVKVKEVFERKLPELTDEFVKKLGQKSKDEFLALVKNNLQEEAERKAVQKAEAEVLETVIDKATFSDMPDVLLNHERMKIFEELKRDLAKHGVTIEQYLADIKKNEQELVEGFTLQAEKRAKASLISRQIAKEQKIEITDEEISAEVEKMKHAYAHNKEAQENLKRPEVRDTIATMLQNRKVMEFLTIQILQEEKPKKAKAKKTSKKTEENPSTKAQGKKETKKK